LSVFQEKINRGDTAEQAETLMTKKGRQFFFFGKNRGLTPSVAAPGVTHPVTPMVTKTIEFKKSFAEQQIKKL